MTDIANVERLPQPTATQMALNDLVAGAGLSWMWGRLAIQDIRLRYRGSILGPAWLTLTTVVLVLSMGIVYARLFHMDVAQFFPYLMIGLIVWQFISGVFSEACQSFMAVSTIIQQIALPLSTHAYRVTFRNLLVFLHSAVMFPIALLYFRVSVGWSLLMCIPALVILLVNSVSIALLLGTASARYRDLPPIIASLLQIVFLVSPIFWTPHLLGDWGPVAALNPFFAFVDILRAPLIGVAPEPNSWLVVLLVTVANVGLSFWLFARFRARIPYWIG